MRRSATGSAFPETTIRAKQAREGGPGGCVISFFRERLKAFNARHKVITYSDTIVRPVSWNGGKDGIDIDGIPYYGSYENEDEDTPVDNVMSIPTAIKTKEAKEVKEYGDSGSHAA